MVQQAKNLAAASQVTVLMRVHSPAQSSGLEVLHVYNGKNKNYYRKSEKKSCILLLLSKNAIIIYLDAIDYK